MTGLAAGTYPSYQEGKPSSSGVATSIIGTVVESEKGIPGKIHVVTAQNLTKILGRQLTRGMVELYYLLKEVSVAYVSVALGQQSGNVSQYPVMRISNESGHELKHELVDFGSAAAIGINDYLTISPLTGEVDGNLGISFPSKDLTNKTITLEIWRKNASGVGIKQKTYTFSLNPDAVDLDQRSLYVRNILANDKDISVNENNLDLASFKTFTEPVYFQGGDRKKAANEDFEAAWKLFEPEAVMVDLLYTGNENNKSIGAMIEVADKRKIQSSYDSFPLTANFSQAKTFIEGLNQDTKRTSALWNGFSCDHPFRAGSKIELGNAWAVAAKCARGYGIAPAGYDMVDHSGVIKNCKNVQFLHEITPDLPNQLKAARINYGIHENGVNMVWEQMTRHPLSTSIAYSRIKQNRIMDLAVRKLVSAFKKQTFMADDDESIQKISDIIEAELKPMTTGNLPLLSLPKRQPEYEKAYSYKIVPSENEADLYDVALWVCPTGATERFSLGIIPVN